MLLQGFPIAHLDGDSFKAVTKDGKRVFSETLFQDLAGNMVSTPVMLATVIATMAAVSWIEYEPTMIDTGLAHGDSASDSPTPATSANPPTPPTGAGSSAGPLKGCQLRRVLHDPSVSQREHA